MYYVATLNTGGRVHKRTSVYLITTETRNHLLGEHVSFVSLHESARCLSYVSTLKMQVCDIACGRMHLVVPVVSC